MSTAGICSTKANGSSTNSNQIASVDGAGNPRAQAGRRGKLFGLPRLFGSALAIALACCTPDPAVGPATGSGGGGGPSTGGAPASGSGGRSNGGSGGSDTSGGSGGTAATGGANGTGGSANGTGGAASGGSGGGATSTGGGSASGGSGGASGGRGGPSGGNGAPNGGRGGFPFEPVTGGQSEDMPIYDGNPPNFKTGAPKESVNSLGQYFNVSVPMLRRYAMDGSKATGFAYLVFPGGAYSLCDMDLHAAALAKRATPLGIAVFGLKYRVSGGTTNAPRDALLDAKRAIRLIKQNAARWGVDVAHLGIIGYSAGSHMANNLAANFDAGNPASADPVERHSSRPAFMGSMATWAMGHTAPPFKYPSDVPPAFFCHARDDKTAPIELPIAIEALIKAQGVATKLDFYATGAHSSCHPGDPTMEGHNWPDKFWPWVQSVLP